MLKQKNQIKRLSQIVNKQSQPNEEQNDFILIILIFINNFDFGNYSHLKNLYRFNNHIQDQLLFVIMQENHYTSKQASCDASVQTQHQTIQFGIQTQFDQTLSQRIVKNKKQRIKKQNTKKLKPEESQNQEYAQHKYNQQSQKINYREMQRKIKKKEKQKTKKGKKSSRSKEKQRDEESEDQQLVNNQNDPTQQGQQKEPEQPEGESYNSADNQKDLKDLLSQPQRSYSISEISYKHFVEFFTTYYRTIPEPQKKNKYFMRFTPIHQKYCYIVREDNDTKVPSEYEVPLPQLDAKTFRKYLKIYHKSIGLKYKQAKNPIGLTVVVNVDRRHLPGGQR